MKIYPKWWFVNQPIKNGGCTFRVHSSQSSHINYSWWKLRDLAAPGMLLKPFRKSWDKLPTSTGERRISEPSTISPIKSGKSLKNTIHLHQLWSPQQKWLPFHDPWHITHEFPHITVTERVLPRIIRSIDRLDACRALANCLGMVGKTMEMVLQATPKR